MALVDRFNHVVLYDRRDWDQVCIEDHLESELLLFSLQQWSNCEKDGFGQRNTDHGARIFRCCNLIKVLYIESKVLRYTAELAVLIHAEVLIARLMFILLAHALDDFDAHKTFCVVSADELDGEFDLSDLDFKRF